LKIRTIALGIVAFGLAACGESKKAASNTDAGAASNAGTAGAGTSPTAGTNGSSGATMSGGNSGGDAASGGRSGSDVGGSSGSDPLGIGSSVPRSELEQAFAKVRCALDLRCGLAFSKLDAASCVERALGFDPIVTTLNELIERGKLNYDPARMAECLTFLRDRECDSFGMDVAPGSPNEAYTGYLVDGALSWAANAACREALLGDVPAKGGCFTKMECASGICELPSGNADCGACVAPLGRGATCVSGEFINGSYFDRCGLDDYCDEQTNRCVARLAENAACNAQTSRACALGLKCVTPAAGGAGTCQRFAAEGEPCAALGTLGGSLCENWLSCSSTCQAQVGALGAAGDGCANGERCLPGLVCDGSVCRAPSAGKMPCFAAEDANACQDGFFCDWDFTEGVCQPKVANGQPCSDQQACSDDLACLSDTLTCGSKKGAGAACSTLHGGQGECAAPLVCLGSSAANAGECKRLGELGDGCADAEECAPGLNCTGSKCQLAGSPYLGCP
jgi:hypothetical protein